MKIQEALSFVERLFVAAGCSSNHAKIVADVLVAAETRGIPSHGLMRIIDYLGMLEAGKINVNPNVKIIHETVSTAVVDGDSCFGMIAGTMAMELAIEKAKKAGTGWVAVRNSNHYGIAGYYAMMALKFDMTGISMTHANPLIAPTFSVSRMLGTNPIAVAMPTKNQPPFIADFATTPVARGKLAIKEQRGEKIVSGLVQDSEGNQSCDPSIITRGGAILPLGSDYEHGSHKGYCMTAIVDLFSSIFSGASFGPFVPPQVPYLKPKENAPGKGMGHFFGAISCDAFQPVDEFKGNMDLWIETFRASIPTKNFEKVLIPGDPERLFEEKTKREGITIIPEIEKNIKEIAVKYRVDY
ncbi:MAG: Ldh family oxidoreductase [Bacteroidales bacterium]|nr:Ldh family oxidoreductase [Bacteroidales bacterium]